jgi:hypothetical protein
MAAANEYQSLRIKGVVHKLRHAMNAMLVEATSDQTITYKDAPFPHFEVQPSGIQIPLHNVASAIPKGASLASKVNKTVGAMKEAREAKQRAKGTGDASE